uniref:Acetylcholinesterase 1 n=1 Tax=Ascaris suum TaxID=6253 RepID=F1LG09_ASCSU
MGVLHGYEINFLFVVNHSIRKDITILARSKSSAVVLCDIGPILHEAAIRIEIRTGHIQQTYGHSTHNQVYGVYESYGRIRLQQWCITCWHGSSSHKQCAFWKNHLPNLLAAVGDMGEQLVRWKQELDRWQNEYIVDWQLHFEQYKKYQSYRYADSDNAQC